MVPGKDLFSVHASSSVGHRAGYLGGLQRSNRAGRCAGPGNRPSLRSVRVSVPFVPHESQAPFAARCVYDMVCQSYPNSCQGCENQLQCRSPGTKNGTRGVPGYNIQVTLEIRNN